EPATLSASPHPSIRASAVQTTARYRPGHKAHRQRAGWPGPRNGWPAKLLIRRRRRGIQPADRAVHQYTPGDLEVIGVIIHFEGNRSIHLGKLRHRAATCGLHEELRECAEAG